MGYRLFTWPAGIPAPKNLSASVKARLQNKARETGRVYQELLQRYAMERFLYRLSQSDHSGQFVLKEALLFAVWKTESERRTTLDIDLLSFTENSLVNLGYWATSDHGETN